MIIRLELQGTHPDLIELGRLSLVQSNKHRRKSNDAQANLWEGLGHAILAAVREEARRVQALSSTRPRS